MRAVAAADQGYLKAHERMETESATRPKLTTTPQGIPITGLLKEELQQHFKELGQPAYRVEQLLDWLYEKRVDSFQAMSNLPKALREQLETLFSFSLPEILEHTVSNDHTQKFLLRLTDGNLIETVLVPATPAKFGKSSERQTLCISSQVGCAYGCRFCASGLQGWKRNLKSHEIVEQLLRIEKISGKIVNNIVFMGMGEPLANFDNMMKAVKILNSPWGLNIGARQITVSTSGLVPQIQALAEQPLQLRLAISLHGATDPVRDELMPVNRRYNLDALWGACHYYQARKKQKVSFEYILIQNVNDSLEQAVQLAKKATQLDCKINLIPYNCVEGLSWERPSTERQHAFLSRLRQSGVAATIRQEKGHDINAACGQLRLRREQMASAPALPLL